MEGCTSSTSPILRIFGCNRSNMAMYLGHEGYIGLNTMDLVHEDIIAPSCILGMWYMHKGYVGNGVLGIHLPGICSIAMRIELKVKIKRFYRFIQDCWERQSKSYSLVKANIKLGSSGWFCGWIGSILIDGQSVTILPNCICIFDASHTLRACLRASSLSSSLVSLSTFFRKAST